MGRGTWSSIVPDGLWEIAEPLIPPPKVRPQGGGTRDTPDETRFAAIIYVLVNGRALRHCRLASGYRSRQPTAGS
ncbi:transposase [Streptomyces sp. SID7982]|nr:transposase [Streptomyces sp. SID7982]NEE51254.1 transposase [Streptomyces sp. SID8455]